MKKFIKLIIPALLIAATVGLATMGCDETTATNTDLSVKDTGTKG